MNAKISKKDTKETEKQKRLAMYHKEYSTLLENLRTFISHNIRQPVAHIMNLPYLLKSDTDDQLQLNKKLMHMKKAALVLDSNSRELSILIYKKINSLKKMEESQIIKKPIDR